jgi:hypothetical protein
MTNTEKLTSANFTIQRFNQETEEWDSFEHLGESGDLDWVREAWRTVCRQDGDGYYRVVSQEGVWFGSSGNPLDNGLQF